MARTTKLWKKQLKDIYGFEFSKSKQTKIRAYENTAVAIWRLKYYKDKAEFTNSLVNINFYHGCKYQREFTSKQSEFLVALMREKTIKGIKKFGESLEVPDKCN